MKKLLLACALLIATDVAMAGQHSNVEVTIKPANKSAWGAVDAAFYSADYYQTITCSVSAFSTGYVVGGCTAMDKTGLKASCTATAPAMLDVMRSVNESSFVFFYWDDSGACTSIKVENGSLYLK